jgi:hypothetical protein
LAIPVSSSIVTNTTTLVLLDQHNTDDRQRPVDRQVGGVGGDNQTQTQTTPAGVAELAHVQEHSSRILPHQGVLPQRA